MFCDFYMENNVCRWLNAPFTPAKCTVYDTRMGVFLKIGTNDEERQNNRHTIFRQNSYKCVSIYYGSLKKVISIQYAL